MFTEPPGPYDGPVPIVTHVHGNHAFDYSDGYAEAWYLPAAQNIPAGFATGGALYDYFRGKSPLSGQWEPGNVVFEYPNDQRATTMWYHDHTLGMTRLNVYAGPAGFYLLRRGPGDLPPAVLPGPAARFGDPSEMRYTRSHSPSRIARLTMTARCSTRTSSSTKSRVRTLPTATSRPSGP